MRELTLALREAKDALQEKSDRLATCIRFKNEFAQRAERAEYTLHEVREKNDLYLATIHKSAPVLKATIGNVTGLRT